jgi:hypothetical protein
MKNKEAVTINRVRTTHKGFVIIVEVAPASKAPLMCTSTESFLLSNLNIRVEITAPTKQSRREALVSFVRREIYRPRRKVTEYCCTKTLIPAANAFLLQNGS